MLLGMDLEDLMTRHREDGGDQGQVRLLSGLAAQGRLGLGLSSGRAVTNAQIDRLSKAGLGLSGPGSSIGEGIAKRGIWSDEVLDRQSIRLQEKEEKGEEKEDMWTSSAASANHLKEMKRSLQQQLSDVSDRESLTDDELQQKVPYPTLSHLLIV